MSKNDFTCAVVRDLLPSYVDGLASPETSAAVEAHLATCIECSASCEAMREEQYAPMLKPEEPERGVDFLKKQRRRVGLVAIVVGFLLVFCMGITVAIASGITHTIPLDALEINLAMVDEDTLSVEIYYLGRYAQIGASSIFIYPADENGNLLEGIPEGWQGDTQIHIQYSLLEYIFPQSNSGPRYGDAEDSKTRRKYHDFQIDVGQRDAVYYYNQDTGERTLLWDNDTIWEFVESDLNPDAAA